MADNYWIMLLRTFAGSDEVLSIYTQPDNPDSFYAGQLCRVTPRHFALRMVDVDGAFDGWLVGRNEDVAYVLGGEDYEQRLKWLIQLNGAPMPEYPISDEYSDLFCGCAHAAQAEGQVITIWLDENEEPISGLVEAVNDIDLTMDVFDFFGRSTGSDTFPLRDILCMSMGAREDLAFMRMHQAHEPGADVHLI